MKIIYTTVEDFIKQEVEEHGWDHVEAQFALGYEPCLIDGMFFGWVDMKGVNDLVSGSSMVSNDTGHNSNSTLPNVSFIVANL